MSRFNPNTPGATDPSRDNQRNWETMRPGLLYAGTVATDGGSAGNATTPCTFTYTITDLRGNVVAKLAAPQKGRLVNCAMNAGTRGTFYYDLSKAVHLWDVNETATQTNCA